MAARARVLDSWAIIAFFENQPGGDRVEELLIEMRETGAASLMSIINVGEVWYSLARAYSSTVADSKISELMQLGIEFVEADWQITRLAAEFKARGNIAYADCFAAAVAKLREAELVTGDREFRQVEAEVDIHWLPA